MIGIINYIDYDKEPHSLRGNTLLPFLYKRVSFEHEKEVRAIFWDTDTLRNPKKEFDSVFFWMLI